MTNLNQENKIANEIADILSKDYKNQILSKVSKVEDINHDDDFWNDYKDACVEGYENVTGKELGEKGVDLLEKAEKILFNNKLQNPEKVKNVIKKSLNKG